MPRITELARNSPEIAQNETLIMPNKITQAATTTNAATVLTGLGLCFAVGLLVARCCRFERGWFDLYNYERKGGGAGEAADNRGELRGEELAADPVRGRGVQREPHDDDRGGVQAEGDEAGGRQRHPRTDLGYCRHHPLQHHHSQLLSKRRWHPPRLRHLQPQVLRNGQLLDQGGQREDRRLQDRPPPRRQQDRPRGKQGSRNQHCRQGRRADRHRLRRDQRQDLREHERRLRPAGGQDPQAQEEAGIDRRGIPAAAEDHQPQQAGLEMLLISTFMHLYHSFLLIHRYWPQRLVKKNLIRRTSSRTIPSCLIQPMLSTQHVSPLTISFDELLFHQWMRQQ